MTTALQKMQKGIGEAAMGLGTAKVALEELGVDIDTFTALSPDEQFKQIADQIANIENPAKRAAMATQIFGRAGADLIPMLEGGGCCIRESRTRY
jgi:hypothetical protein